MKTLKSAILTGNDFVCRTNRLEQRGDARGLMYLGKAYLEGDGIPQNYLEAQKVFSRVSEIDSSGVAFFEMGKIYIQGLGVPRNVNLARQSFEAAGEKGLVRLIIGWPFLVCAVLLMVGIMVRGWRILSRQMSWECTCSAQSRNNISIAAAIYVICKARFDLMRLLFLC